MAAAVVVIDKTNVGFGELFGAEIPQKAENPLNLTQVMLAEGDR